MKVRERPTLYVSTSHVHGLTLMLLFWGCYSHASAVNTVCRAGHEWSDYVTSCQPCDIGFFRSETDGADCVACPEGFLTATQAATHQSSCNVPIGNRDACESGTEWVSDREACTPCAVSTYRTQSLQYWCLPCPVNTYTQHPGATSISSCTGRCPAGTEWNKYIQGCQPCNVGHYRGGHDQDVSSCQPCEASLTTAAPGATTPALCQDDYQVAQMAALIETMPGIDVHCPVGMELTSVGCEVCPLDTYRDVLIMGQCKTCTPSLSSPTADSYMYQACDPTSDEPSLQDRLYSESCPAGTEWEDGLCRLCEHGSYRTIDQLHTNITTDVYCQSCPPGFTTPTPGATTPEACIISLTDDVIQYQLFFTPELCPAGSEWSAIVQACLACPKGFYRPQTIQQFCGQCPPGLTSDHTGSTSQLMCNVSLTQHPVDVPITTDGCASGYEPNSGHSACVACHVGTYKAEVGHHNCVDCPLGAGDSITLTTRRGAVSHEECLQKLAVLNLVPPHAGLSTRTSVTISFQPVTDALRVNSVVLAGQPCVLTHHSIEEGKLTCVASPSRREEVGEIQVILEDGRPVSVSGHTFTYRSDPVVTSIDRKKCIASGGLQVDVNGRELTSATSMKILLTPPRGSSLIRVFSECHIISSSSAQCSLPNATAWFSADNPMRRHLRSVVMDKSWITTTPGFIFDGLYTFADLALVLPQHATFVVHRDPIIFDFAESGNPQLVSVTNQRVLFKGVRLDSGTHVWDYHVTLDDHSCEGVELNSQILVCLTKIPYSSADDLSLKTYSVQVNVGSLVFTPGKVKMILESLSTIRPSNTSTEALTDHDKISVHGHTTLKSVEDSGSSASTEAESGSNLEAGDTGNDINDKLLKALLPLSLLLAVLAVMALAMLLLWLRRRHAAADDGSKQQLTAEPADSPRGSVYTTHTDPSLPPLPIASVFGPERVTDRGRNQRPLALPADDVSPSAKERAKKMKLYVNDNQQPPASPNTFTQRLHGEGNYFI